MSAFSVTRRLLSLRLPQLPTDRIKRQRARSGSAPLDGGCIIVAKHNGALQIAALDDAATRRGLSVGLPLANARAVCPDIEAFDDDAVSDAALLSDIADWCDRYTPLVALDPPHALLLDITGCAHLFGGEAVLLQSVCSALSQQRFQVRAAIAGTAACARALSRMSHGRVVRPGGEAEAVQALPIAALGAEPVITQGLRRAGLKTIGDVVARQPSEIAARFGEAFVDLLAQAQGRIDTPISPRKPLPDYIVEKRFAEPVATDTVIAATLSGLAQTLVSTMEPQGKGARRLEAMFFRTDGAVRTLTVETGQPVTRAAMIDRLFRERLDALADPIDPGFGFDLIRLAASRTEIVVQQQRDLDARTQSNDEVSALIDRIAARIGGRRIVMHLPVETHLPERATWAAPAQHHAAVAALAQWPEPVADEPPLRPLRLFDRPERIEVPFAQVPDGPPARFRWRRMLYVVARAEGPERIAMEWWKHQADAPARDYFRVEDAMGLRFWIYRNGLYGGEIDPETNQPVPPGWFLHGLFA
jgi:protein ImuB